MSEAYLSNLTREMVTQLGNLLTQEIKLLFGLEDELETMKNSILKLQVKLLGAEEQQAKDQDIKNFLIKIKDTIYDADDLIDELSRETLRRQENKTVRSFFFKSNPLGFRLKMAHRIKKKRVLIDKFIGEIGELKIEEHIKDVRDEEIRKRETHSFILEEEVVGRDEEKTAIMAKLFELNVKENVSVIAIVGIGGLGKTAIAQSLYNNIEVTNHFELKMWVCVSEEFDVKTIVGKMIESATKKKPIEIQNLDSLQIQMRQEIEGKKYLLVMDDVWNQNDEKWVSLEKLLRGGATGSRIVITTRSRRAAEIAKPILVFPIEGLSETNSLLLFEKMAFEKDEAKDPSLIDIGKEIVKKLNGVPLAIRTIGRVLCFKSSISEWISFRDYELSTITQQESDMMSILKISYNNLPTHLKQCFSYSSLFPKGFNLDKDELIKLWIAQGFIDQSKCHEKYSMEDLGDYYFTELYWRSFFQNFEKNPLNGMYKFKIHDLIHDLGQLVSSGEYILLNDKDVAENMVIERTRHVSFVAEELSHWKLPTSTLKGKKLRSLLFPPHDLYASRSIKHQAFDLVFSYFSNLRVLSLRCLNIQQVPASVGMLTSLRYLNLSQNKFLKSLPDSIPKLKNLQTLDLSHCTYLQELPRNISDLVKLRHLDIDDLYSISHMPFGLSRLTCLQTMNLFVVGKEIGSGLDELNGLDDLRGKLEIKGLQFLRCNRLKAVESSRDANLKEKQGLREVGLSWVSELSWGSDEAESIDSKVLDHLQLHPNIQILNIGGYGGVQLSKWVISLSNLVEINIYSCQNLKYLPLFDHFPLLESLHLEDLNCLEYIDNNGNGSLSSNSSSGNVFFQSLRTLSLQNLSHLKQWCMMDEIRSFHRLLDLSIRDCKSLTSIPILPRLESLRLSFANIEMFEMIIGTTSSSPSSSWSSSFSGFDKLKRLTLEQIEKLDSLSEEFLQNLTSLKDFTIGNCDDLRMSLSRIVQHLPTLNRLWVHKCPYLDIFTSEDEEMQWKTLVNLHSLTLSSLRRLVSLPNGLQYISTLRNLSLVECENLKTLPEWIGNLSSLSMLQIASCQKLESLPQGIRHLISLQELRIIGCSSKLTERCNAETGEDWPLISHIPQVYTPFLW